MWYLPVQYKDETMNSQKTIHSSWDLFSEYFWEKISYNKKFQRRLSYHCIVETNCS